MVEFKVGPEGPAFMEINGRLWGSLPLAVLAGCDIPGRMLAVHLGRPGGVRRSRSTVLPEWCPRNLDLELVWIGSVLPGQPRLGARRLDRRAGLAAAVDLFRPTRVTTCVAATTAGRCSPASAGPSTRRTKVWSHGVTDALPTSGRSARPRLAGAASLRARPRAAPGRRWRW